MAVRCSEYEDDEYIDMEITSFSNLFTNSRSSREFEFQMSSLATTSPADELFYKGKLLPLGLLEMEEFPLATTVSVTTPTSTSTSTSTSTTTPFDSCNISPSDSCSVSPELNPKNKSWTKKLKLSWRLNYLKAFFGKSGCSGATMQSQFRQISQDSKGRKKLANNRNRRSFSMAFSSTNKSSASSSNGFQYLQFLKRSSSVNVEMENPIQGAIAHCKRSQMSSEKSVGDGGFHSNVAVPQHPKRPDLWRG